MYVLYVFVVICVVFALCVCVFLCVCLFGDCLSNVCLFLILVVLS